MSSTITVSTIVLFLNALWDIASALAIFFHLSMRRCTWLANAHIGLWATEEDRSNHAAAVVMAALLLQWAFIRLHGALSGPMSEATCSDASVTYVIEAGLIGIEVAIGNMHVLSGWAVAVACVVCWGVVLRECVEG
jgi:hypothetical protein